MRRQPASSGDNARLALAPEAELLWDDRPHVYRGRHGGDWLLLLLFAAIPIATGLDLWYELGWSSQLGRAIAGGGVLAGLLCARAFYSVTIAVRVEVSREALAVVRGRWRQELAWPDVVRLRERVEGSGLGRGYCLVAEAEDGRRLQIRQAAIADYARLRREVYAAFQGWREHADLLKVAPPIVAGDLYESREQAAGAGWLRDAGLALALLGLYLWAVVPPAAVVGLACLAGALGAFGLSVAIWIRQQTVLLDDHAVEARTRLRTARLEWSAITHVERRHPAAGTLVRLAGATAHAVRTLARRPDPWTGGVRWRVTFPEDVVLRSAGRRVRIHLRQIARPAPLVARLQRHLQAAKERAAAVQVARTTQRLDATRLDTGG